MDEKEFEDICYICRRPESKAGRMFHLPNNICICDDCMHKTMDAVSQFDYQQMMNNPMFMNMLNNPFNPYGDPTKSDGTSGQKSAGGGNERSLNFELHEENVRKLRVQRNTTGTYQQYCAYADIKSAGHRGKILCPKETDELSGKNSF